MLTRNRRFAALVLASAALLGSAPWSPASAQFSTRRLLAGDTAIAPSAGDQRNAAVARGAGQSLLVWEDWRASLTGTVDLAGPGDLFAARLDDQGALLDTSPILVRIGTSAQIEPKVAWNGTEYLVVWSENVSHAFENDKGVFAARVTPSGQVLDDPPILLEDQAYVDEFGPVVASDGTGWVVAWSGIAGGQDAIKGCPVAPGGAPGAVRVLMTASSGFTFPRGLEIAYDSGRFLLVDEHFPAGSGINDAFGQLFDSNLGRIGGEIDLGLGTNFGTNAAVAGNGNGFCVAWNSVNGMRATPVAANGAVAVPGGVPISGALYVAYQHPSVTWDGANWVIAFPSSSGTNYALEVSRLSSTGSLLAGSPSAIAQGAWQMERPACAATSQGSQVIWADARNALSIYAADRLDLYSSTLPQSGAPGPAECLSVSPPAQTEPDIAGSFSSGYLVAFLSQTQAAATIAVQRVNSVGASIDAQPIPLSSGLRGKRHPAVAWNGALWLVVWTEDGAGPFGSYPTVYGRRVGADGSVLDPTPIAIMPGGECDTAAIGDEFLVVTSHEPVNHFRSIYTQRVRGSDGALLDAAAVQRTGSFDFGPTAVSFGDRWLLAWAHQVTHDAPYSTLRAMEIFQAGGATTPALIGDSGASNVAPSLAGDGAQALLTWQSNGDIRGRRILADGTPLDTEAGLVISAANNVQSAPRAGWNGTSFLVAFLDKRIHANPLEAGIGDVYACNVSPGGQVLDPNGLVVAADPRLPEGEPAVAGDLHAGIVAFSALGAEAPFSSWRINLRSTCPPTNAYCTAKVNSLGCSPAIGFSGVPQIGAPSGFVITGSNVLNNKLGILLYGVDGPAARPFSGGTLCVRNPLHRTPPRSSGGSATGLDCTGVWSIDFNAFASGAAGGHPIPELSIPGTTVHCQWWGRDPGFPVPDNVSLTDALQLGFCF